MTRTGNATKYEPYNGKPGVWVPDVTQSHVHIGAYLPPRTANWTWLDRTPFVYSNWVNNTAIFPSNADEPIAAILPDFEHHLGGWDNIDVFAEARAGVCAYDLC